jgi:hypothetical protein
MLRTSHFPGRICCALIRIYRRGAEGAEKLFNSSLRPLRLCVLAFVVYHDGMIGGWIAGYCSLALVRENVTLSGAYELQ